MERKGRRFWGEGEINLVKSPEPGVRSLLAKISSIQTNDDRLKTTD